MDLAKSALFKSYGVIYLFDRRGHIYSTVRILLVSKCHETETSTFDRITSTVCRILATLRDCAWSSAVTGKILTGLKLASVTQVSER